MVRAYQGIMLAIAGLILIGAGEPPKTGNQSQDVQTAAKIEKAGNSIASAIIQAGKPLEKDGGCEDRKDNRNSDLCAQWKAADSAAEAAQYSLWTLLISAIGTGLLVWTLWETRQTSRRELRAYLSIEPFGVNEAENGLSRVPFEMINNGQTPAYDLRLCGDFLIVEGDPKEFNPYTSGRLSDKTADTDHTLGANTKRFSYAYINSETYRPHLDKIARKEAAIIHYGYVNYTDIFKKSHRTSFAFYHWGDELSDVESKRCRFGNDAT